LEIVSRELKTNEHKLENNRRPHIIDLLSFWGEIVTSWNLASYFASVAQFPSFLMR
jgi:hypothetical protein